MSQVNYLNRQRHRLQGDLDALELVGPLPFINGQWFFVDPESGSNAETGRTVAKAVADLPTAYGLCTTGDGDGIVLISSGVSSSTTTSYLDVPLLWTKHGITVVGRAAPSRFSMRSRVANKERTTGAITTLSADETGGVFTFLDSASGFITAGFAVGQTVELLSNSTTQDGSFTITVLTAGVMTVSETLTDESAVTMGSSVLKSYQAQLINVSGDNNVFVNINVGNFGSSQFAVGAVLNSGNRNAFLISHMYGGASTVPAGETGLYDLKLDGAEETYLSGCVFGSDTTLRDAANGNILFDGTALRTIFEDCIIMSYSKTSGKGAIKSADAGSISGVHTFRRCSFINWNENGIVALTSAFIGTKPTSGAFLMDACSLVGWAAWDSVGGNDMVYVTNSAAVASGAGGIATTV